MLKNELKTEAEVEEEILETELGYEHRYHWYLCDIQGTKAILPDTSDVYGRDIFETQRHNRVPIPDETPVWIFPERYLLSPSAQSQFLKRVKYSEIPQGWLIKPGVVGE